MKILIADEMHPSLFERLEACGWAFDYRPKWSRSEILDALSQYEGLIIRSKTRVDTELIAVAPKLQFVARAGAGLDLIDEEAMHVRGIRLFHAGEGNRDAVGEHAVGMLLALLANICRANTQVRQGVWDREGNRGVELMGKTVGLIGYGNNGKATAKRLSGFGCTVLAHDKYLTDYGDTFAVEASIARIQAEADILSLHVPLTDETRLWIDQSFISSMQKPFYLLNVARGEIVHLSAVAEAIRQGKLLGACLDVLENEKLSTLTEKERMTFEALCASDRVIFTPHIAGWTHESYERINEVLVRQIQAAFG